VPPGAARTPVATPLRVFKTFCLCMYNTASATHSQFGSAYIEKLFGCTRRDSITGIGLLLELPLTTNAVRLVFFLQTSVLDRVTKFYSGF